MKKLNIIKLNKYYYLLFIPVLMLSFNTNFFKPKIRALDIWISNDTYNKFYKIPKRKDSNVIRFYGNSFDSIKLKYFLISIIELQKNKDTINAIKAIYCDSTSYNTVIQSINSCFLENINFEFKKDSLIAYYIKPKLSNKLDFPVYSCGTGSMRLKYFKDSMESITLIDRITSIYKYYSK